MRQAPGNGAIQTHSEDVECQQQPPLASHLLLVLREPVHDKVAFHWLELQMGFLEPLDHQSRMFHVFL